MDEVGRGALAGPVAVGAFFFQAENLAEIPEGLRDSKLISEPKRPLVAERVQSWGKFAVGMSSAAEIEEIGITAALAKAAARAIELLPAADLILLDGSHNWLGGNFGPVQVQTKADRDCASVAAASVVAKVQRDALMTELANEIPTYGFERNKGYSSPSHIQALRDYGPSDEHRKSWLGKILAGEHSLF
jgi:ribonuclease HII